MKRRVLLFNTIVIFTSLAVLLAVSGLITRQVMGAYAARGAASASETTAQVRELLDGWAGSGERWQSLDLQLGALGYGLHVTWHGREAYSSLDAVQEDLLHQNSAVSWPEGESCLVWLGGTPAVGLRAGAYVLVAVDAANVPEVFGRQRPQLEAMLLSLAITGATAIAVIVALSLVSTHFLVRLLLRPVNALADAARRVEVGDYTQPVGYAGQDEFTAVCAAFEQMQRHLLEEREKNAAYERARTDLVAGISHDLRTPLTSVQGCLKGLRDGVAGTPKSGRSTWISPTGRPATWRCCCSGCSTSPAWRRAGCPSSRSGRTWGISRGALPGKMRPSWSGGAGASSSAARRPPTRCAWTRGRWPGCSTT